MHKVRINSGEKAVKFSFKPDDVYAMCQGAALERGKKGQEEVYGWRSAAFSSFSNFRDSYPFSSYFKNFFFSRFIFLIEAFVWFSSFFFSKWLPSKPPGIRLMRNKRRKSRWSFGHTEKTEGNLSRETVSVVYWVYERKYKPRSKRIPPPFP